MIPFPFSVLIQDLSFVIIGYKFTQKDVESLCSTTEYSNILPFKILLQSKSRNDYENAVCWLICIGHIFNNIDLEKAWKIATFKLEENHIIHFLQVILENYALHKFHHFQLEI
jgi:hypothetical protein